MIAPEPATPTGEATPTTLRLPLATATAPPPSTATVPISGANLREGPGPNFPLAAALPGGSVVTLTGAR